MTLGAADRRGERLDQGGGRVEVRQALRVVDAADLGMQARHLADHGLLERARAAGEAAQRRVGCF
jgi:hypothetical protein